jgi:phospholipid transport system substrate-binding protein
MMSRRRLLLGIAMLALAGGTAPFAAASADPSAAKDFVKSLADEAITVMARKDVAQPERLAKFKELFNRGFDVEGIGRFVLGRYVRDASPAELAEYNKLFEALILSTYASRFSEYSGETLSVLDSRLDDDRIAVASQIERPNGPAIRLDWRISESAAGFKISDVIVEGVSMSVTQRSEFSSVIQRGGGKVESLLVALRAKTGIPK